MPEPRFPVDYLLLTIVTVRIFERPHPGMTAYSKLATETLKQDVKSVKS